MLYNIRSLYDAAVIATDGEIGRIKQFYFDDEKWVVRYLVVNAGSVFHHKQVLISPISVKSIDWDNQSITLSLTRQQVLNSPDIDTDMPISRQHEIDFHKYFGWSTYWGLPDLWAAGPYPIAVPPPEDDSRLVNEARYRDSHLRSSREVIGYHIHASDGEFGHLEDFIIDETTWAIRYVVMNTKNWWSARLVLIASHWIKSVSWDEQQVYTELSQDFIKNSPEYNPNTLITRNYEQKLNEYFEKNRTLRDEARRRA